MRNKENSKFRVFFPKRPKIVRRFKSDEDGATAIEFAMVAMPFFLLIFAIIESSLYFLAGQYLESSVDRIGRMVRTGELDNTTSEAEFKTQICNAASVLFDCNKLKVDLAVAATFDNIGDPPAPDPTTGVITTSYSPPGASQIARLAVMYEWPIVTNFAAPLMTNTGGRFSLITAVAVFRTEPYQ